LNAWRAEKNSCFPVEKRGIIYVFLNDPSTVVGAQSPLPSAHAKNGTGARKASLPKNQNPTRLPRSPTKRGFFAGLNWNHSKLHRPDFLKCNHDIFGGSRPVRKDGFVFRGKTLPTVSPQGPVRVREEKPISHQKQGFSINRPLLDKATGPDRA